MSMAKEPILMWEEHKRNRFQQLRQREIDLTDAERSELALLIQELEAAEAANLAPATERLRQEREAIETQNRKLEGLTRRRETLVLRLSQFLGEARAEREAIDRELAAVLTGSAGPEQQG
jgi:hypothetical protein